MFPDLFRDSEIKRTRVGLLFFKAQVRQIVEDGFGLDLEFAGQLVDADLIGVRRHRLLTLFLF